MTIRIESKIEIKDFLITKKVRRVPTGDYDGGILCSEGDNVLIGGLEDYGRPKSSISKMNDSLE